MSDDQVIPMVPTVPEAPPLAPPPHLVLPEPGGEDGDDTWGDAPADDELVLPPVGDPEAPTTREVLATAMAVMTAMGVVMARRLWLRRMEAAGRRDGRDGSSRGGAGGGTAARPGAALAPRGGSTRGGAGGGTAASGMTGRSKASREGSTSHRAGRTAPGGPKDPDLPVRRRRDGDSAPVERRRRRKPEDAEAAAVREVGRRLVRAAGAAGGAVARTAGRGTVAGGRAARRGAVRVGRAARRRALRAGRAAARGTVAGGRIAGRGVIRAGRQARRMVWWRVRMRRWSWWRPKKRPAEADAPGTAQQQETPTPPPPPGGDTRTPPPPPGGGPGDWMRPPPGADRIWVDVERVDQPQGQDQGEGGDRRAPSYTARRPLPPGPDETAGSDPVTKGTLIPMPTPAQTQYADDSELTVYDVIDADRDAAEEIAAGADAALAAARGSRRMMARLEELNAKIADLKVPGSLPERLAELMDLARQVEAHALGLAAALPQAAEAVLAAATAAEIMHKPLADVVRDHGHARPAEAEYHDA